MKVIPAIDLLDGKVVRLKKGDYEKVTVYNENPIEVAQEFADGGFKHIHIVDLDGARSGDFTNLRTILKIINQTGLSVQMGGGIRNIGHVRMLFEAGINKIVCSSMAVKNEPDWIKALTHYGGGRCILGMDLKDGKMAYSGWLETMEEPVNDYLDRMIVYGLEEVLCTDISRDGMLSGANIELYQTMMHKFPGLSYLASGGVADNQDLLKLQQIDIHAVVVGRAYLDGLISLKDMVAFNL
ncbi:MAG TPA: 1-(5-phosphoribosyl)-5-[(5-phosphoribosylamino)methylideneamino]imidazole-4-carboxamide isomerase [Bacteroidetes bacterium]|nr:1-(5-phosphoribosyl)-5-[(5-phosphoribosylamino)methylideneamino]imidazole-4-carboxamide isomerase [Bacteroidota bacterium]